MNYRNVLLGLSAIMAAALIFDLPLVGAVQINILRSPTWTKWDDADIFPESYVQKDLSVERLSGGLFWSNANVLINISNTTESADIEKVYAYKCAGMGPDECADTVSPESYDAVDNQVDIEIEWSGNSEIVKSCSSSPNSCEEFMNVFLLYKLNDDGKVVWFGDWDRIERREHDFPLPYFYEYRIDEVGLYTDSSWLIQSRDYVLDYLKVPFNPARVSGAVFNNANYLYELSVSSSGLQDSPSFSTTNHTGDQIDSISNDYSFVFAETDSGIMSPVTLYLNPTFTCGSYGCETDKGETIANCCYDCGCNQGYYCDGGIEGTCKPESAITLGLYGTQQTSITNCNQENEINITVKIDYPPSGMSITSSEYRLNGTAYPASCEEVSPAVYRCPVTVPPMPDCQEGEYTICPNYIDFSISYPDGPGSSAKDLSVEFPDITVGSYECGQNGCESWLGENSDNCCYDCGCESGYCDIEIGAQPNTGTCREDIDAGDIRIMVNNTHFHTHDPVSGDNVGITMQISNAPSSIDVTSTSCEMECSEECDALCHVSCSEVWSSDLDVYNSSCLMTFFIDDYDPATSYSLYPTMNMTVMYNNGSAGKVVKTFSEDLSTVSIGATWCGDGVCSESEGFLSCCYDCPCPGDQYCDTKTAGQPGPYDRCRSSDIGLVVDDLEPIEFDDYYETHYTKMKARVTNPPSSLDGTASCSFGDGNEIYCYMECERPDSSSPAHALECNITIPVIDYKTSSFYDPNSGEIVIGPNTITYSVTYNNGSGMVSADLRDSFPDITISVKPRCGSGPGYPTGLEEKCMPYDRDEACEEDLGEDSDNCCCDCPCPEDEYCFISSPDDTGTCKEVSSINLYLEGFDEDARKCEIQHFDQKKCVFTESTIVAKLRIEPEADYTEAGTYFTIDGEEVWANCILESEESPRNRFSCSSILPIIKKNNEMSPGTENQNVDIEMSVRSGGMLDTSLSARGQITVSRIKSQVLKDLEKQKQEFDKTINKLDKTKDWLYVWVGVIVAGCTLVCIFTPAKICLYCGIFGGCMIIDLVRSIKAINFQMGALKDVKDHLIGPVDTSQLYDSNIESMNVANELVDATVFGLACLKGFAMISSLFTSAGAAATTASKTADVGNSLPNFADY